MTITPPTTSEKYSAKQIPGDLIGGLMAAIVALPLALAFGVSSGAGAVAGLYGAVACGIIAAAFGGAPAMVSGPTGPVTVMVAALISEFPNRPHLVFAAAIVAGIFQVIFGKLKVGQLIQYIPHPVVSGFMTGIGVIIISIQLLPLLGLPSEGDVFAALQAVAVSFTKLNTSCLIIGLATLATIYLVERLPLKVPPLLVALVGGTAVSLALNLDIPRIGAIPSAMPGAIFPEFELSHVHVVLSSGLALAIVGCMDSLLTAVMVDKQMRCRHDSNKELVAQGLSNIAAGFIGGIPGSGTTMPSIVNVSSGGRSRLSGLTCGLLLLSVLLGFGSIAAEIPLAVLAGILISVGLSIIDRKTLLGVKTAPRSDSAVLFIVFVLTVFVDLIMAVAIGVALASTLFAKKMADANRSTISKLMTWSNLTDSLPEEWQKRLYLYNFIGPMFFGEVTNFVDAWKQLDEAKIIILEFNGVPFIDISGAYALEEAIENWQGLPNGVIFVGLSDEIKSVLAGTGVELSDENSFNTLEDALRSLEKRALLEVYEKESSGI